MTPEQEKLLREDERWNGKGTELSMCALLRQRLIEERANEAWKDRLIATLRKTLQEETLRTEKSEAELAELFADTKHGEEMYIAMRNRCASVETELAEARKALSLAIKLPRAWMPNTITEAEWNGIWAAIDAAMQSKSIEELK